MRLATECSNVLQCSGGVVVVGNAIRLFLVEVTHNAQSSMIETGDETPGQKQCNVLNGILSSASAKFEWLTNEDDLGNESPWSKSHRRSS